MATTTTSQDTQNFGRTSGCGAFIPFEAINEPGRYVCNWSGHLLRVPQDGVAPGRSPLINIVGREPLFVTKLSDNPYIPMTKARLLAANFDVGVNFYRRTQAEVRRRLQNRATERVAARPAARRQRKPISRPEPRRRAGSKLRGADCLVGTGNGHPATARPGVRRTHVIASRNASRRRTLR